jgi:hypothetical protein
MTAAVEVRATARLHPPNPGPNAPASVSGTHVDVDGDAILDRRPCARASTVHSHRLAIVSPHEASTAAPTSAACVTATAIGRISGHRP